MEESGMKLKQTLAVAVATLMAVGLAACGSSSETPGNETTVQTLTVAMPDTDWFPTLAEAFHANYPSWKAELSVIDSGEKAADKALGSADVVAIDDSVDIEQWIADQKLLDVTDLASAVYSQAVLNYTVDSTTGYGLPYQEDPWVLFYNQDLLTEAGLATPTTAWLWTEFVTNAKTITEKLASGGVSGTFIPDDALATAGFALAQNGNSSLLGGQDYTFLKPYYERAIDLISSGAAPSLATVNEQNLTAVGQFSDQKAALVVAPESMAGQLTEVDFTWGMAPAPQRDRLTIGDDKVAVTVGRSLGFVIPADIDVDRMDGAKDWLTFMSSEKAAIIMAGQGMIGAVASDGVTNAYFNRGGLPSDEFSRFAFQTRNTPNIRPVNANTTKAWDAVTETTSQVLSGDAAGVDSAIADLTKKIDKIVN
jgi:multiple sugar transport system substrate-binding protein